MEHLYRELYSYSIRLCHLGFKCSAFHPSASIMYMFIAFGEETHCMHTHTSALDRQQWPQNCHEMFKIQFLHNAAKMFKNWACQLCLVSSVSWQHHAEVQFSHFLLF